MSAWVHQYAWRLLGGSLAMFGGSVGVVVRGWPAWRPDWFGYAVSFAVCAAVTTIGGLLFAEVMRLARKVARTDAVLARRIAQAEALDAAKVAHAETAFDVLLGEKWEQRGLTTRLHLTGGVYSGSNDGRRTTRTGVGR